MEPLISTPMIFFYCIAFVLLSFHVRPNHSAPQTALVNQLPGFSATFPSKHYSGYVTLDESHGNKLFYYLVVSERDPTRDPVVLWLNGGPGCSSFDGFVYENGPFNFEQAKTKGALPTLHLNPYSWSKVSNILYLDSPSGVGFSYSKNQSDYQTGDLKTALDSHAFLLKWFELYPEFLSNPFFVAGESYAGIYVPTLAHEIVKGLDAGTKPILNFKGYLVGNGVTDDVFDGNALVPFAHGMALISDELYEETNKECKGNFYTASTSSCSSKLDKIDEDISGLNIYDILEPCYHGTNTKDGDKSKLPSSFRELGETNKSLPVRKRIFGRAWPYRAPVKAGLVRNWPQILNSGNVPCIETNKECKGNFYTASTSSCSSKLDKIDEDISGLNIYDILEPCYHGTNTKDGDKSKLPSSFRELGETNKSLPVRKRIFGRAWPYRAPVKAGLVRNWPQILNSGNVPCINDEVATSWLNSESVRKAIHADPESVAGRWELCTDRIFFNHDAGSMIPYHRNLTLRGFRALIFSGDHDMCVPYTGSEAWTRSMGYRIIDEWRPWISNDQVAGFTQGYANNLTFLTVKGSGHTVPEYKPREALDFYTRFLEGKPI